MKRKWTYVILAMMATLAAAAVVVLYGGFGRCHAQQYKMVRVGGEMNQCDCTKRLEK